MGSDRVHESKEEKIYRLKKELRKEKKLLGFYSPRIHETFFKKKRVVETITVDRATKIEKIKQHILQIEEELKLLEN